MRHRPTRLARDEAERLLQRAAVNFVDDAVDVEAQTIAPCGDVRMKRGQRVGPLHLLSCVVDRQAELRERIERRGLRFGQCPTDHFA